MENTKAPIQEETNKISHMKEIGKMINLMDLGQETSHY
jgi:hypothetical protein